MIGAFRKQYFFLSNFYTCSLEYNGLTFKNVEAAFQAQKCVDDEQKKAFMGISGADAKSFGRRVKLRSDWENVKVGIMRELVRQKFIQNPELLKCLIDTGEQELVEGNYWGDTFWGVDSRRGGKNMLGKILEEVRAELKGI